MINSIIVTKISPLHAFIFSNILCLFKYNFTCTFFEIHHFFLHVWGFSKQQVTIAKELEKQRSIKGERLQKAKNIYFKTEEFWLNKKGCPIGTVPIRRLTEEQLQNAKDASLSISLAEDIIDVTTSLIIQIYHTYTQQIQFQIVKFNLILHFSSQELV